MMREEGKQGEGKQESLNTQKSLPPISELPMLLTPSSSRLPRLAVQGLQRLVVQGF